MWTIETTFFTKNNTLPATVGPNKGKTFATSDLTIKKMHLTLSEERAKELAREWNKSNEGNPSGATYKAVPL